MKETKLSDKKIINTLAKKSFIEIYPICDECAMEIMFLVYTHFSSANFNIWQVEDNIYSLRINV